MNQKLIIASLLVILAIGMLDIPTVAAVPSHIKKMMTKKEFCGELEK